jgi:hypothetical protein
MSQIPDEESGKSGAGVLPPKGRNNMKAQGVPWMLPGLFLPAWE